MMKVLTYFFTKSFNYFDVLVIAYASELICYGHWLIAVPLIFVGTIISVIIENALRIRKEHNA